MTDRQMRLWLRRRKAFDRDLLPGGAVHAWAMACVHRLGGPSAAARACGVSKQRLAHYLTGHVVWPVEILRRLAEAE